MKNTAFYPDDMNYEKAFNAYLHGQTADAKTLENGAEHSTESAVLPYGERKSFDEAIAKESVFRNIANIVNVNGRSDEILASVSDDIVTFVAENGDIPVRDVTADFSRLTIGRYKLATLLRLPSEFVHDAFFDLMSYLRKRMAKSFGRAEDKTFINGTGTDEPTGILHDTLGAEVSHTTAQLSYNDLMQLYYSLKPEYRSNAVWMMNDKTANHLRTLTDEAGQPVWNQASDTILGKPVVISEYMPDMTSGKKPIAFGDFEYYWVIKRGAISVRTLTELYALNGQTGYLAYEFIDGRLVRREAVKTVKIVG